MQQADDHEQDERRTTSAPAGSRSSRTAGRLTTEAKMIIAMPLPMPRWLISSPIHISTAVPATRVG